MLKKLESIWATKDGAIFIEEAEMVKGELSGRPLKTHQYIAFNVKPEVAEHIVKLHNESLA